MRIENVLRTIRLFLILTISVPTILTGCEDLFGSKKDDDSSVPLANNPKETTYTVTYDGNGHTEGSPPSETSEFTEGETVQVLDNTATMYKSQHSFNRWNLEPDGSGTNYSPGDKFTIETEDVTLYAQWDPWSAQFDVSRTFRARTSTDNTWYDVEATLQAVGDKVLVYTENTQIVSEAVARDSSREFDDVINSLIRENYGDFPDVDENGKVILLLLDIIDGFTGTGGYVAGYFDPTHIFSQTTYTNSNEADMIFMDVNPATPGSRSFFTTIAHEMQHLVNFGATVLVDNREQDLWINEGLSTGAEYLYHNGEDTGQTHLEIEQDFFHIALIPSGQQAFTGNTSFARFFLL